MSETAKEKYERLEKEADRLRLYAEESRGRYSAELEELVREAKKHIENPISYLALHRLEETRRHFVKNDKEWKEKEAEWEKEGGGIPF